MLTESLLERLKWFDCNKLKYTKAAFFIEENTEEKKQENYAKISINLNQGEAVYIKGEQLCFPCLQEKKVADAIIFHQTKTDTTLHIIECKTTVKEKEWIHIKKQFQGALISAIALHGVLNLKTLKDVKLYTAYRKDRLTPSNNPDPVLFKTGVGTISPHIPIATDWLDNKINLLSLPAISHQKIQLDTVTGIAQTELNLNTP